KSADSSKLTQLLAEDFAGTDLNRPRRLRAPGDFVAVERLQDSGQPPVPLNREAFVARLLRFRKEFSTAPKVQMSLMTLGPAKRGQPAARRGGTPRPPRHDEPARGPPAEVMVQLRYQVPRPTKEALDKPGWLRSAGVLQAATAKSPRYLFAEVGKARGLD